MAEMIVAKPFSLTLDASQPPVLWPVGVHKDVPDDVANHWFVKHHLAKDGKLPEPSPAAPLTNEERASVKASLDAAEKRAADAEANARSAVEERDRVKSGMASLVADNEALRGKVASLEADLDKATKPAASKPATPAASAAK